MPSAKGQHEGMMPPPRGQSGVPRPQPPRDAFDTYEIPPGQEVAFSTMRGASVYMGFAGRGPPPAMQSSRGRAQEREYCNSLQEREHSDPSQPQPQRAAQPTSRSVTPTSARLDTSLISPREPAASGLRIPMLYQQQDTDQSLSRRMQSPEETENPHRPQYEKQMAAITPVPDARGGTWRAVSPSDHRGVSETISPQNSPVASYVSGAHHSTNRYHIRDEAAPVHTQSPLLPRQKSSADEQYSRSHDQYRHQGFHSPPLSQDVRYDPTPIHSQGRGSPRGNVAPQSISSPRSPLNVNDVMRVREQQAATMHEKEPLAFRGPGYRGFSNVSMSDKMSPTERNASAVLRELVHDPPSPVMRTSPRSPRSPPPQGYSASYATGLTEEGDKRVEDLVNAVMILRDELMRLREGNSTEFTMHANAIASVREELTDLRRTQPVPVSVVEDEGISRKISGVAKIHEESRAELQQSVTELREYIDKTVEAKDETIKVLQVRVRELQESLDSRAEQAEELTERLEALENQNAAREEPSGYIAADGRRLSTMTELMDECKERVLDDLLSEMRTEVDALKTRIQSMESDVKVALAKEGDVDAIEGLQLQIDRLNEKLQGVIKNNHIADVASRIDDVEAMHLRLEQKVITNSDSSKVATAVENQRMAIAELSQNISTLTQKVEARDKCAAKLKSHVSELVNALSTLQTKVSFLLTHHSDYQHAPDKHPVPCANPYIAILPQSFVNADPNGTGIPGTPSHVSRRLDDKKSWRGAVAHVPQTTNIGSTVRAIKCPCSPSLSPTYACSPRICSPPPGTVEQLSAGPCKQAHGYTFSGCKRGFSPHAECRSSPNGDVASSPVMQTRWLGNSSSCVGTQSRQALGPRTSPYRDRLAGKIAGISGGTDSHDCQNLEKRVERLEGFHR